MALLPPTPPTDDDLNRLRQHALSELDSVTELMVKVKVWLDNQKARPLGSRTPAEREDVKLQFEGQVALCRLQRQRIEKALISLSLGVMAISCSVISKVKKNEATAGTDEKLDGFTAVCKQLENTIDPMSLLAAELAEFGGNLLLALSQPSTT